MKTPILVAGLAFAVISTASVAQAPAAPAGQPLGGPVVQGVCLLSREAVFANAAIGKVATTRLQELARVAQAEIDAERKPLEAEAKALQGQPDNAATKARREALGTKWQALQLKAEHNSREIEATRGKALERIANETQPVIAQVYGQKKCGLVLDRSTVLGGNFANDLTADVVRGVDAKITTITFERERLPVQAQPGAAPAR
ncbi:OmpH family outer membrane protein [Novosphingobium gossypii]|uniref:OmpH family outer membrane protein n=1 Tax=Novosphingobium gossypii TaxID=1604774 RepID=UPI003D1FB4F1